MNTRSTRVASPAPLTPDFISAHTALDLAQQQKIEELSTEVRKLRAALQYAQRQHVKVERTMAKYNELLEKQIAVQREAFELLGKPLVENPLEQTR